MVITTPRDGAKPVLKAGESWWCRKSERQQKWTDACKWLGLLATGIRCIGTRHLGDYAPGRNFGPLDQGKLSILVCAGADLLPTPNNVKTLSKEGDPSCKQCGTQCNLVVADKSPQLEPLCRRGLI